MLNPVEILDPAENLNKKQYKAKIKKFVKLLDRKIRSDLAKLDFSDALYGEKKFELLQKAAKDGFDKIFALVAHLIINARNIGHAVKLYVLFVEVAAYAGLQLKNLHLEQAIVSGLGSFFVSRIFDSAKFGYELLPEKVRHKYEMLSQLNERNHPKLIHQNEFIAPLTAYFQAITLVNEGEGGNLPLLENEVKLLTYQRLLSLESTYKDTLIDEEISFLKLDSLTPIHYTSDLKNNEYKNNKGLSDKLVDQAAIELNMIKVYDINISIANVSKGKMPEMVHEKILDYWAFELKQRLGENKPIAITKYMMQLISNNLFVNTMIDESLRNNFAINAGLYENEHYLWHFNLLLSEAIENLKQKESIPIQSMPKEAFKKEKGEDLSDDLKKPDIQSTKDSQNTKKSTMKKYLSLRSLSSKKGSSFAGDKAESNSGLSKSARGDRKRWSQIFYPSDNPDSTEELDTDRPHNGLKSNGKSEIEQTEITKKKDNRKQKEKVRKNIPAPWKKTATDASEIEHQIELN